MTRPTTKLSPDDLLTRLHDALAVLGLGELRRALDETIAEVLALTPQRLLAISRPGAIA